jgi:hypothetical protein
MLSMVTNLLTWSTVFIALFPVVQVAGLFPVAAIYILFNSCKLQSFFMCSHCGC